VFHWLIRVWWHHLLMPSWCLKILLLLCSGLSIVFCSVPCWAIWNIPLCCFWVETHLTELWNSVPTFICFWFCSPSEISCDSLLLPGVFMRSRSFTQLLKLVLIYTDWTPGGTNKENHAAIISHIYMAWVLPTWYSFCMPNGRNLVWLFWVSLQSTFLLQPLLGSEDISWE
jgi:hypothetical protein